MPSHKNARKAAEAAACAGDQGQYWEMHDLLLQNYRALGADQLPGYAERLGLNTATFTSCLEAGTHSKGIDADLAEARKAGVSATPMFFLGTLDEKTGKMQPIEMLRGAQSYASFKAAIDKALAAK